VNINNNHTLFLSIAHFAIQICFWNSENWFATNNIEVACLQNKQCLRLYGVYNSMCNVYNKIVTIKYDNLYSSSLGCM
jgi:hypothetical protein